jgi:hypothetical protein
MSRLINFHIIAMDRTIFRQGITQKSWTPCPTGTWGGNLPLPFPGPFGVYGVRYVRYPCRKCRLLWLSKRLERTRPKNTTDKAIVVSCHLHETQYCLHVRPSGYISWKYPARERKSLRLLSPATTENRQRECFRFDCRFYNYLFRFISSTRS